MKRCPFIILLLIALIPLSSRAQGDRKTEQADRLFEAFDYTEAIYFYELAHEKSPDNPHITRRIAQSYRALGDLSSSVEWYEKTLLMDKSQPLDMLHLAEGLKCLERYPAALSWYRKYHERIPGDSRAVKHLADSLYFSKLSQPNQDVVIRSLGINSEHPAFGLTAFENEYIFSSPGTAGFGVQEKSTWNDLPYLDLYVGEKSGNHEIVNVRSIDGAINTRFHDGPASYDGTTKTIFITRNNVVNGKPVRDNTGTVNLKIFQATRVDADWGEVKELPFNSDEYSCAHPCISYDGKELYFISNRPGGYGGTDIYRCSRSGDSWTKPENLGPGVNTEGNEMFPYVFTDGSLYFASDGHAGLGGLDLFRSVPSENGFGSALNLGAPYSTRLDDFSFIKNPDGNTGYFSSNRSGGAGNDDIFWYEDSSGDTQTLTATLLGLEKASGNTLVKVFSPSTGERVMVPVLEDGKFNFPGRAGQSYEFSFIDQKQELPLTKYTVPKKPESPGHNLGTFSVFEDTLAEEALEEESNQPISTKGDTADTETTDDTSDETEAPVDQNPEYTTIDLLEKSELNNVYFDYNSSSITTGASKVMDSVVDILQKNPAFRLEISAHTDPRGSGAYNEALSRKRAEAARAYLIRKGISEKRIVMNWYGSTRPAVKCPPGVDCDEYTYQMNRRAEFKIIPE